VPIDYMATQPKAIAKERTLQSIDKELEMLLALHDDLENQLISLMHECERLVRWTRAASA
jgi:hypothetical protein